MRNLLVVIGAIALLTSCTATQNSMREPNARVEFNKSDFAFSGQVTGEAVSTKVFFIDIERLFIKKMGKSEREESSVFSLANIPIIGNVLYDKTYNYALYDMMEKNKGYDVVFYPQFTKTVEKPIGLGIYKITTVKATAKLGKIK